MKLCENGMYRNMTQNEQQAMESEAVRAEATYWRDTGYDTAVDAQIRRQYSVSQEFAILRQKDEKPEEYSRYYAYCESCKEYVRSRMAQFKEVDV